MKRAFLLALALEALLAASAAEAQQFTLAIKDGRVSLDATNASVRAILVEWARVGGVTILNGDKVSGPTVTLKLPNVPERQALETLLRGVSGYMLATRPVGKAGASAYDRILILPTSTVVAPAAGQAGRPGAPGSQNPGGAVRAMPFTPGPVAPDPDEPPDTSDVADDPQAPRPGSPGRAFPGAPGFPAQGGQPQAGGAATESGSQTGQPSNPFGAPAGSSRPGVVLPVPQPRVPSPNGEQPPVR